VSTLNPADCVWKKQTVTPNTDINGVVIDTHITLACTTKGHMEHTTTVPGDAQGNPV
jgi:hypothetical protein